MKKEDINIVVSLFVAGLTIYSTFVVVKSVREHHAQMEKRVTKLENPT